MTRFAILERGRRAALALALGVALLCGAAQARAQPEQVTPTPARALRYVAPEYPPEAQKAGLEGSVILQIDVDKTGTVLSATVINPAGHGFDEAAVEAVKKTPFEPARLPDGTPIRVVTKYRFDFTLHEKPPAPGPDAPVVVGEKATTGSLHGVLLAAEGDAPLAGASVSARPHAGGALHTTTTGADGRFAFDGLDPGTWSVVATSEGWRDVAVDEEVVAGDVTEVKYRLSPQGGGIEVTVRGARSPREVTRRTIERAEIEKIPGTNGDALRAIQNLPGVARPPALLGVLLVRGSGPQDTQVFIDGTLVPLVYHFGGLSSVVPTEIIEKLDFFPGNFGAEYGRVNGGIVEVGIRAPRDDGKYHGLLQLDLIDARTLIEGPIPFFKKWTFLVGFRRSWLDSILGSTLKAAGASVTSLPVYYDYQAFVHTAPTPRSNFRLGFFGSNDAFALVIPKPSPGEPALTGSFGLFTSFERIQARLDAEVSDTERVAGVLALGHDGFSIELGAFHVVFGVKSASGRLEYTNKLSSGATLHVGTDVYGAEYNADLRIPAPPRPGEPPNQPFSTREPVSVVQTGALFLPAAYVEVELVPDVRAKIVPGLRLDSSTTGRGVDVSPRINARYDLRHDFPRTTAKGGVGFYDEPPQFQQGVAPLGTEGLRSQRAIQYGLGVEQEITRPLEASVEGFYKQLDDVIVANVSPSGTGVDYSNEGRGYVVGLEALLKYHGAKSSPFFGWLAYTLSRSARVDHPGEPEHLVVDQTHILTAIASYDLGGGFRFGARFRLVSGNLVSPNVCDPASTGCDPLRTNSLFHGPSGVYVPIPFSGPASERLPIFHELDMRLDKEWQFKSWKLTAYLDLQNAYNRANVEGIQYNFNYTARTYVSGLPILPAFGLRGEL